MLPINLCSVATSNQGNGARRHAVIRMMKSFACRPMPVAAVGPSDTTDLLTAAQRPYLRLQSAFFALLWVWVSILNVFSQNNDCDRSSAQPRPRKSV